MNKNIPLSGGFGNKKPFARTRFDSLDDTFAYTGQAGKVVTVRGDETGLTAQAEAIIDDHKVATSGTDTSPGYLVAKLEAGIALAISENGTNPNKKARVSVSLGTLSDQAAAGNDSRLSDSRTPTVHDFAGSLHQTSQIAAIQSKVGDGNLYTSAASEFYPMTQKVPVSGDLVLIEDAADGYKKKAADLGNIPVQSHDLAGSIHNADTLANLNAKISDANVISDASNEFNLIIPAKASPVGADKFLIEDSADGWKKKSATLSTIPAGAPSGTAGGDLAGTYPNPTVAKVSKSFAFTGIIADTISAQKDNYNPTGLADASTIQLTLSGNQTITGIAGGVAGRLLIIQSGYTGSTDKLTLKNNSSSSIAANRFYCPLSTDFVLSDDNCVIMQYDGIQERWIIIATCQAPYGTGSNTICEGNDSRLSDARTPTSHALGGSAHSADTIANLNSKLSDGDVISTLGGEINALTAKTTPTSADLIMIEDVASSNAKKKSTIAQVIAAVVATAYPEFQFYADQLRTPVTSEWPRYGSAAATLAQGSVNNAMLNRQFDDTADEGVALDLFIPSGATNIILDFYSRAQTAPGTAKQVLPGIYVRQIADNAAAGAFSALIALTAIDIPITNAYYQYDTQTIALSTLSLTAGRLTQILLERTATSATDNLVGDWNLNLLRVRFS